MKPPRKSRDPREEFDAVHIAAGIERMAEQGAVFVDDRSFSIVPRAAEVTSVILPLLSDLRTREYAGARGLVGVAAPPGAGKSIFLGWLAAAARVMGLYNVAFLALDAYHLPNAELATRTGIGPNGEILPLRSLKGTPETFDPSALLRDLHAFKRNRACLAWPGYSRKTHDPVPQAIQVEPEVEWAFVEGNFLFLDAPVWRDIRAILDVKIALDAEDEILRRRLALRHAYLGRDPAWIENHFRRTDGPNIARVRQSLACADLELFWAAEQGLHIATTKV